MKKRKFIISIIALATLLISSAIYAYSIVPKEEIQNSFSNLKEKLENQEDFVLVSGDGFQITAKRFIFYKENKKMLNEIQNINDIPSDIDLLNELIKTELLVQYAKDEGLKVSDEEITDAIEFERKVLQDPNLTGEENEIVKEIMKNRIEMTGLSEKEFWNSKEIREQYGKHILIGKLYSHLLTKGEIEDIQDFQKFQDKLLEARSDSYTVDMSNIP
jgi:hypothetical protein